MSGAEAKSWRKSPELNPDVAKRFKPGELENFARPTSTSRK
jgi:hypothetical protein